MSRKPDLTCRINYPEIMDNLPCPEDEFRSALGFLRFTNRYLGGSRIVIRHLARYLRSWPIGSRVKILDVGCGLADIPVAVARWARARGLEVQITGLEKTPQTAALARENVSDYQEITIQEEDIFALKNSEAAYDYVVASLFLHHLPNDQISQAIRRFDKMARYGVVISDLRRSPASFWGVKTLSNLIGNEIVRYDGPLSVRRSFRTEELQSLAYFCGLPYLKAREESFFRLSLAGEKNIRNNVWDTAPA